MIISLTTLPSRIPFIEPTITHLKKQGFPVHLWIPKYVKRLGQEFDGKIPKFFDGINYEVVEDRGSISKLLCGLEIAKDLLITADDDVMYPDNWAKNLIEFYEWLDEKGVCCYRGRIFRNKKKPTYGNSSLIRQSKVARQVDLVCGTWGALYHKDMFSNEIFVLKHHMVDDIVISCELQKNKVPRWCLPSSGIKDYPVCRKDSLWGHNRRCDNNDKAIKDLWIK
jgi:hypothetical protein